jgi:hypothetical protein
LADLKFFEKDSFEQLLGMGSGYVLDFSDRTFSEFFNDYGVNIDNPRYFEFGTSKAKRLRSFWKIEPNDLVGRAMEGIVALAKIKGGAAGLLVQCDLTVDRLLGRKSMTPPTEEQRFLSVNFEVNLDKLDLESALKSVIDQRIKEIMQCFEAGASLSVILLCGSTLEGLLLNVASKKPAIFNKANGSPKRLDGTVKMFSEWSLKDFVDVAYDCRFIKKDTKDFSHSLRNFRNHIHPHQQMVDAFSPDKHTAGIAWQVLKAAVADLSGARG